MRTLAEWLEAESVDEGPVEFTDRYTPKGLLGRGGMGAVYAVLDRKLGRVVAMKVLAVQPVAAIRTRFEQEARITAQLQHPNIVPVYDYGHDAEGRPWFTMKRVEGLELNQAVLQKGLVERVGILLKVCDAVAFAHDREVLHRDLKPENVMVGAFGEVLVMDWGLARTAASREREGAVAGTPAYMAPEQARGQQNAISPRTDVWALGALLYEMLADCPPLEGPLDTMLAAARRGEVNPLARNAPDAPGELAAIVARAMQPVPQDRYASSADLAEDLRAWLEGHPVSVLDYGPAALAGLWLRRNRRLALAVAIPTVVAVVLGIGGTSRYIAEVTLARQVAETEATNAREAEVDARLAATVALVAQADMLLSDRQEAQAREIYVQVRAELLALDQPTLGIDFAIGQADLALRHPVSTEPFREAPPRPLLPDVVQARIDETAAVRHGLVSPDGRFAVLATQGASEGIYMDLETGEERALPGFITRVPLITEDRVVLVVLVGATMETRVLDHDFKLLWSVPGQAERVLIDDTGVLLYDTNTLEIRAFDADGTPRWSRNMPGTSHLVREPDGTLLVLVDGGVVALDDQGERIERLAIQGAATWLGQNETHALVFTDSAVHTFAHGQRARGNVLYRAPEGVHLYGLALRGEQLVTAGSDGLVRVHDAEGEVHQTLDLEGIVYSVAVDDEGNILAGGHKGKLARWSADGTLDWRGDAEFTITSVAPGPDGFLVCRGRESAQIWSTEPALVRTLSDVGTWDCNWAEGDPLTSGVHPQNADSSLERWTATGPKTLLTQQGWLYRASVRGQRVAQSTQRGELVVVNIDGTELHRIQAHEGAALEAIWLDDHTVMTGGFDRQARIWDLRTETALRALPHEGMVNEAAWDADARVLYTVSDDGTLRVWPLSY